MFIDWTYLYFSHSHSRRTFSLTLVQLCCFVKLRDHYYRWIEKKKRFFPYLLLNKSEKRTRKKIQLKCLYSIIHFFSCMLVYIVESNWVTQLISFVIHWNKNKIGKILCRRRKTGKNTTFIYLCRERLTFSRTEIVGTRAWSWVVVMQKTA